MDKTSFDSIINRMEKFWVNGSSPWYTGEDLKLMAKDQLCEITYLMVSRFTPGSYTLSSELYYLVEYLDTTVSVPEDKYLEKNLHIIASLVLLTRLEGFDFNQFFPERISKHLTRIIGAPLFKQIDEKTMIGTNSMEMQPTLQIATFMSYPVLEGVIRRKLSHLISPTGKVLKSFQIVTKLNKSGRRNIFAYNFNPQKPKTINRLDHELYLLEQETPITSLKTRLSNLNTNYDIFGQTHKWRWPLLHGSLTSSWHSLQIILLTYLILLEYMK